MKTGKLYKKKNINGEVIATVLFLDDISEHALKEIKNGSLFWELFKAHILETDLNHNFTVTEVFMGVLMDSCPDLRKDILESFFDHEKNHK